jgi:hypothetical protein
VSKKKTGNGRPGFLVNLGAGDYGLVERATKVLGNIARKAIRRQGCCGNYGDPGC